MRLLTWQDFELLVDLVFSSSGWRRLSQVGRTQKTIDLELVLPSTAERAFVQVKSQATRASLDDYVGRLAEADAYDRMFSSGIPATSRRTGAGRRDPARAAATRADDPRCRIVVVAPGEGLVRLHISALSLARPARKD